MAEPPFGCSISMVFMDSLVVKVRDRQRVVNKAILVSHWGSIYPETKNYWGYGWRNNEGPSSVYRF